MPMLSPGFPLAAPIAAAVLFGLAKLALYWVAALPFGGLPRAMCHWDCGWYLSIVTDGYQTAPLRTGLPGQANWAFFPLYPLTVRCLRLLGLGPAPAGIAVSAACTLALAALGTLYARLTRPAAAPWLWPVLFATWPFGFYWQAILTEGPYALLTLLALWALAANRVLPAATATALLSATRPTGILLAAWVAGHSLWCGRHRRRASPPPLVRVAADALLPAAIAPAGLAAFAAFLGWHTGDPLAFSHVEVAWDRGFGNPLRVLATSLTQLGPPGSWRDAPPPAIQAALALAGLAAGGRLAWRRRYAEAWFLAATVMLAASTGTVSLQRYVGANPVLVLAAGDALGMIRGRRAVIGLLAAMAVLQLLLLLAWFTGPYALA